MVPIATDVKTVSGSLATSARSVTQFVRFRARNMGGRGYDRCRRPRSRLASHQESAAPEPVPSPVDFKRAPRDDSIAVGLVLII